MKKNGWLTPLDLSSEDQLLLYSACDSAYLDFAISLIRSLEIFSPGNVFLLHLVNPNEEDINRINNLNNLLKHTKLSVSCEYTDLTKLSDDERRTYYACARLSVEGGVRFP